MAAAGLPVELSVSGRPRALPPGVDLACYRVVQEALTNVMKHAGQPRTAVRLDYRPDELIIDVSDDGPPPTYPSPFTGAQARRAAGDPSPGRETVLPGGPELPGGRGLLGLRERVSLYGGAFDAGPRQAGGWRVTARLPLDPRPDDAGGGPAPERAPASASARP